MIQQWQARLNDLVASYERPDRGGLALGILKAGEEIRLAAGFADLEHGVKVTPQTPFHIASLTKQFLAALVLDCEGRGLLSLDDDLKPRSPFLRHYHRPITWRHLLSHTSGLLDTFDLLDLTGTTVETPISTPDLDRALAQLSHLNFEPGTGFVYSNTGFRVADAMLEDLTGQSLAELLRERIFLPLGMHHTALEGDQTPTPRDAQPYWITPDGPHPASHGLTMRGDAGLVSTLDDLLLWERHVLTTGQGRALLDRLMTPTRYRNGVAGVYGLGCCTGTWRGLRCSGHGGLLPGIVSRVLRFPDQQCSILVLANSSDVNTNAVARAAAEIVLDLEPAPPPDPQWQHLSGHRFIDSRDEIIGVEQSPDGPRAHMHGWTIPLEPRPNGARIDDDVADRQLVETPSLTLLEWGQHFPLTELTADFPVTPLTGFAGSYANPELGVAYTMVPKDGALWLHIAGSRGDKQHELTRLDTDLFMASDTEKWLPFQLTIRFLRDTRGASTHIRLNTGRTRGLLFARVKATA